MIRMLFAKLGLKSEHYLIKDIFTVIKNSVFCAGTAQAYFKSAHICKPVYYLKCQYSEYQDLNTSASTHCPLYVVFTY